MQCKRLAFLDFIIDYVSLISFQIYSQFLIFLCNFKTYIILFWFIVVDKETSNIKEHLSIKLKIRPKQYTYVYTVLN